MDSGWIRARWDLCLLLAAGAVLSVTGVLASPHVTLAWDPSVSSSVAGYRLYYGVSSRVYTNVIDVGSANSATVSNLVDSTTYFFAVTAYDVAGLESDFSDEISYTVPSPVSLLRISFDPVQGATLIMTGPSNCSYNILTSTNLLDWMPLTTITLDGSGASQYMHPVDPTQPTRFYRLQQTPPRTSPSPPVRQDTWTVLKSPRSSD